MSSPCFLRVADASAASIASNMMSFSTPFSFETASTTIKISLLISSKLQNPRGTTPHRAPVLRYRSSSAASCVTLHPHRPQYSRHPTTPACRGIVCDPPSGYAFALSQFRLQTVENGQLLSTSCPAQVTKPQGCSCLAPDPRHREAR